MNEKKELSRSAIAAIEAMIEKTYEQIRSLETKKAGSKPRSTPSQKSDLKPKNKLVNTLVLGDILRPKYF